MVASKSFSKREKILMIILGVMILTLMYYQLVYLSTDDSIYSYENQIKDYETMMQIEEVKYNTILNMKNEIENAKDENIAPIPKYDNKVALMDELNDILASASYKSLDFVPVNTEVEGVIIRRYINITLKCDSLAEFEKIISALQNGKFRSLINNFEITSLAQGGINTNEVTATLNIIYFEKK